MRTESGPRITLIVPAYNEGENILHLFLEVEKEIRIPHESIVIVDSDTDNTLYKKDEIISRFGNVRFVKNRFGPGVINAFKTGFEEARTEYVVPIMADLSDTPETVNRMYEKGQEGYDLIIASRYMDGGEKIGGPWLKRVLSKIANLSLYALSGIPTHDMTNAFIMHRKAILDNMEIESTGGFEVTMELIAKAYIQGARICEIPTINRDRKAGKSKFRLAAWIASYFYWFFYILFHSWRRCFIRDLPSEKKKPRLPA